MLKLNFSILIFSWIT